MTEKETIIVPPASAEDAEAMFDVRTIASQEAYVKDGITPEDIAIDREMRRPDFMEGVSSGRYDSLCVKTGGLVVGMCVWDKQSTYPARLEWLYILPEHQRQGIGVALLQRALKDIGPSPTVLETAVASEFYERFGFATIGTKNWWVNSKPITEKIMRRDPTRTP